jgi:hypothetical protein
VAGHELVEGIDELPGAKRAQRAAQRPRQPQLREHRHTAATVARDRRAVAADEPEALAAPLLGDGSEQELRLLVCERKQRKLFLPIEPDDDPRRPATELSAAVVEHDGALELHQADSVRRRKPPWCS